MAIQSCGCWYIHTVAVFGPPKREWFPLVDLASHTTILSTTSRTTLKQTFINPQKDTTLDEVQYNFPLYDGVSVVGFETTVAGRRITGVVKEKSQAKVEYQEAVDRGETAGLLEQHTSASDVFTTSIGNVPPNEKVVVEITYLGELPWDAEADGNRFTIPTFIAPRYGSREQFNSTPQARDNGGIKISVDVALEEGSIIRGLQSPSHPIAVTMGRNVKDNEESFDNSRALAALSLQSTELDKDFVLIVLAKEQDTPRALLETHNSLPDHRAIMTTLVPRFNLPQISPEIVFVVDRSGSMGGKIEMLVSALKVFLKSLPVGVKFNICSFGSGYDFLFSQSKGYDQSTLTKALQHLDTFAANYGGTEMLQPVKATVSQRLKGMPLEVMIITDGQIWDQEALFDFINKETKQNARFFSLGIGNGASTALVEGISRAGHGFAQFVRENEKMDKRVVRMLKGALTPHLSDYTIEIKYEGSKDDVSDDFEIIEPSLEKLKLDTVGSSPDNGTPKRKPSPVRKIISLFDRSAKETPIDTTDKRFDNLPDIPRPKLLQTPYHIPTLYAFNRTTVYLLLSEQACRNNPKAVVLKAMSDQGPLELETPIQDIGHGVTVHQMAARKAVQELEEGRGWINEAQSETGTTIKDQYEGYIDALVEREAIRLGVKFQVANKWCSFVAVEKKEHSPDERELPQRKINVPASGLLESMQSVSRGAVNFGGATRSRSTQPALFGGARCAPSGPPSQSAGYSSFGSSGGSLFSAPAPAARPAMATGGLFGAAAPVAMSAMAPAYYRTALMAPAAPPSPPSAPVAQDLSFESKKKKSLGFGLARYSMSSSAVAPSSPGKASPNYRKRTLDENKEECDEDEDEGGISTYKSAEAAKTIPMPVTADEKTHELIAMQNFDGSWDWTDRLAAITGLSAMELGSAVQGLGGDAEHNDKLKATLCAIAYFKAALASEKDTWEMVVEKAEAWVGLSMGKEELASVLQRLVAMIKV